LAKGSVRTGEAHLWYEARGPTGSV
jgi:hypothetical protein